MRALLRRMLLPAALALAAGACAVGGPPSPPGGTMPAARAGLRPEYRLFYDALADYGEWVLIEPYGWLFRPSISYPTWRPYEDGYWVPTDTWGWVWSSADLFGWATDHYGRWFRDDYQGWVWQPGLDWGPAWVDWTIAGDYVGWRPLGAASSGPTGDQATSWAPLQQLGSTDLKQSIRRSSELGAAVSEAKPVENSALRGGATIHLGPSISSVERATGRALTRAKVEDLVPRTADPTAEVEATRRAGERTARDARSLLSTSAAAPARLPVVRPIAPASAEKPAKKAAPADTTRR